MYQLKSKGFALYTIANLVGVIIPFFYFLGNTIGQLFIAGQFFITALFILLYASQLKHMPKKNEPLRL
jgi:multisubunit Na+/H+ antiporter MnhG subunit